MSDAGQMRHSEVNLSEVWLAGEGARQNAARLRREFPRLNVQSTPDSERAAAIVYAAVWHREPWDPYSFDDAVLAAIEAGLPLCIATDPMEHDTATQVVTRYQRCLAWPEARHPGWRDVLRAHRALHDLNKPLVRADYEHALDARAWMLRLDPEASVEAQLAILFHDVERLVSEADARIEQLAPNYQAFKDAHAQEGARMADAVLASCGISSPIRARVAHLIARHESPDGATEELSLMNDADVLSFFSLNSPGYRRYFGREQTRRKVRYSYERLSPRRRDRLAHVRLNEDVAEFLREEMAVAA
ncbi:DUF4202 family protein [Pendulispora brunnea]|uniref:DUF4202 family protein n=1 Tax=Pendulispora brunnea TaxID=2905690 RepID=A0ABZ2K5H4_9BACT